MQGHAVRQNAHRPHSDNGTNAAIRGPRHDHLAQLAATLNSRQRPVVQRVVTIGGTAITEAEKKQVNDRLATLPDNGARGRAKVAFNNWIKAKNEKSYNSLEDFFNDLKHVYDNAIAPVTPGAAAASAASATAASATATTDPLRLMKSPTDLSGWSSGDPNLRGAHHKFPKRALGWLHSKMSARQKAVLNAELQLPERAGALDLARLPSNLIAPNVALSSGELLTGVVSPELRTDDPDHGNPHLPATDLVYDTSRDMTPRSAEYHHLATHVIPEIWQASQAPPASGSRYVMSNAHASQVIACIVLAEQLHADIEGQANAHLPSHRSGDAFEVAPETAPGQQSRFRKKHGPLTYPNLTPARPNSPNASDDDG